MRTEGMTDLAKKERRRSQKAEWVKNNRDRMRELQRRWALANPEKMVAADRRYKSGNRTLVRGKVAQWKQANPDRHCAHQQKRKAAKQSLLHREHDTHAERILFVEAQRLTTMTGDLHHVDHIIPLVAGGWHHHLNMQVLPSGVNTSKGANPFWELEGFKSWRDVPEHLWPAKLQPAYRALQ